MIELNKNLNVFTENFTDLFVRTGLTKHKFAELIGIDHCLIADYLNGTIPLLRNVIKICDYFNVSLDYIMGRESEDGVIIISNSPKSKIEEMYEQLTRQNQLMALGYITALLQKQNRAE